METFEDILDKVMELWKEQKEKAIEAEGFMDKASELMERCETIEAEMVSLLRTAKEMYPQGYEEFMRSFGPPIEESVG